MRISFSVTSADFMAEEDCFGVAPAKLEWPFSWEFGRIQLFSAQNRIGEDVWKGAKNQPDLPEGFI